MSRDKEIHLYAFGHNNNANYAENTSVGELASRDKQIEEMAKVLCCDYDDCTQCICKSIESEGDGCTVKSDCEKLYNADYRKASDVAREIFEEIDESFSQMLEEAENTIADAIQEENRSVARIAQYGRDVLILARNTLGKILKKKYESEGADDV